MVGRYGALLRLLPGQGLAQVASRIAADQLIFAPTSIPIFFGALHTLEGRPQQISTTMQVTQ